jgi:hypothetical protein
VAAAAVAGAIDAGFAAGCASGLDVSQTVSGASNLVVSIDTARHASEFQPPPAFAPHGSPSSPRAAPRSRRLPICQSLIAAP